VLGLDVGGANLKAAHTDGTARSVPFELWKAPASLTEKLIQIRAAMPPADLIAVTMTGESCDCFDSKRQGVVTILDAVQGAAEQTPVVVWCTDGRFVDLAAARQSPLPVASANWLALATFAGRYAPNGPALLIDIGSTTTDTIALLDGRPIPKGRTDTERFQSSELVYVGVRRTPLCALMSNYGAAELFATTRDVYLLLDLLPEDPQDINTADGRPATKEWAGLRIARTYGADLETSTEEDRHRLAEMIMNTQTAILGLSFYRVAQRLPALPQTVVLAGEGEFLIRLALKAQQAIPPCRTVSLTRELGAEVSRAACAYAMAMLATEKEREKGTT
jgi:probable H4MPT-linked C1 transfer pathway protein